MKFFFGILIALLVIGSCGARPSGDVQAIKHPAKQPQIFTDAFIRAAIKYCHDQGKHVKGMVCHIPEGCAIVCEKVPET